MQTLFLMWNKKGALVRAECFERIGGVDLNATARARMRILWDAGTATIDRCTIYLLHNSKLTLVGEERRDENGIFTQ